MFELTPMAMACVVVAVLVVAWVLMWLWCKKSRRDDCSSRKDDCSPKRDDYSSKRRPRKERETDCGSAQSEPTY